MGLEYGVADEDAREQMVDVLVHAFAIEADHIRKSRAWAGDENLRVVQDGPEVLGGLTMVRMGQFFGGRSVPMVGIAGVATRPSAARRGVATQLMHETMRELAAEGVALSALYASTQQLYRKVDYEPAGSRFEGTLQPQRIEVPRSDLSIRAATEEDRPRVEAFYAEHGRTRAGHLDRGIYIWNRIILARMGAPTYGTLIYRGDELEGYVFYRKKMVAWPGHTIAVSDLLARSSDGYHRIWGFLRDLSTSVVSELTFCSAPNGPAYLAHPHDFFGLRLTNNWMLRIVDAPAALRTRGYPLGVDTQVHFELSDEVVPANAGRFVLRVRDGKGEVEAGGRGDLELHVRALAGLYSGFVSPHALSRMGRLSGPPQALAAAANAFAGSAPWMPDMF